MTCGIYLITNNINGKQYVGQSSNIERRVQQHLNGRGCGWYLCAAIQKYGRDNFTWEILIECSGAELFDKENEMIREYNPVYNLKREGESTGVHKHAESSKLKMKAAALARDPEVIRRMAVAKRGSHASTETKAKMSQSHKGQNKGKALSPEHCQHLSDSHKGKVLPEEQKHKIREAIKIWWNKRRVINDR